MKKMLCFDMDGTIANFYGVSGWLSSLKNEDVKPYREAAPLWNMEELAQVLSSLRSSGWEIRVVTWLSKDSSKSFKDKTREAKLEWLAKYNFPFDHFHGVQYGATKADSVRRVLGSGKAVLVDDNDKVRAGWHLGMTIDPREGNLIEKLQMLLDNCADCDIM